MSRVHVIIGEDDYLVSETAKKLIGDGQGLEVVDSAASGNEETRLRDIRAADASFSTPPFLDPVKVTWWKNVKFLPGGRGKDGEEKAGEAVKAALEAFARKIAANPLPDNQTFILSGPRLLATSVFAKTLGSVAQTAVFSEGKPWERARAATERVVEMAAEAGLRFERGVAELFVSRVGVDTRSLMGELAKLRDYLGPGASVVTAADVGEIASQGVGVEPDIWTVTDALGARDVGRTLDAARRFEQESGFAILVTTTAERFFRQLARLKDAEAKGRIAEATAGENPYAVRKNTGFLRNWTLAELRAARARFMDLRERAVSSAGSVDALVTATLARVCRRPGRGAA